MPWRQRQVTSTTKTHPELEKCMQAIPRNHADSETVFQTCQNLSHITTVSLWHSVPLSVLISPVLLVRHGQSLWLDAHHPQHHNHAVYSYISPPTASAEMQYAKIVASKATSRGYDILDSGSNHVRTHHRSHHQKCKTVQQTKVMVFMTQIVMFSFCRHSCRTAATCGQCQRSWYTHTIGHRHLSLYYQLSDLLLCVTTS